MSDLVSKNADVDIDAIALAEYNNHTVYVTCVANVCDPLAVSACTLDRPSGRPWGGWERATERMAQFTATYGSLSDESRETATDRNRMSHLWSCVGRSIISFL